MHFKPVLRSVDESAAGPEPSQVFGRLLADRIRPSDLIYAFNHIIDRPSDVRLLQTFPVVDQAVHDLISPVQHMSPHVFGKLDITADKAGKYILPPLGSSEVVTPVL